jgi:hypothetical protein
LLDREVHLGDGQDHGREPDRLHDPAHHLDRRDAQLLALAVRGGIEREVGAEAAESSLPVADDAHPLRGQCVSLLLDVGRRIVELPALLVGFGQVGQRNERQLLHVRCEGHDAGDREVKPSDLQLFQGLGVVGDLP